MHRLVGDGMALFGWDYKTAWNTPIPMIELAVERYWDVQKTLHGAVDKTPKNDPEGVMRMLDGLAV